MPFQPYVPSQAIASPFAAGIGPAASKAWGLLGDYMKDKEESKGLDESVKGTLAAHKDDPKFLETFGDQLGKLGGMSLSQKKSFVGTLAGYDANKRLAAEQANKAADNARADGFLKLQQDQMELARARQDAEQGSLARFNDNVRTRGMFDTARIFGMESDALSFGNLAQDAAEAGALGLPGVNGALGMAERADRTGRNGSLAGPLTFTEDPVTGTRFAQSGASVLPSGRNPEKTPKDAQAIHDEDGNVIGYGVANARGGMTVVKAPSKDLAPKEKLAALNAQLRNEFDPAERERLKGRIAALMGEGGGAAPAAAGASFGQSLWEKFRSGK